MYPRTAEEGDNVAALLLRSMSRNQNNPALWDGTKWLSFHELHSLVIRAGGYLRSLGAKTQDRVVIACSNSPEFRILELAVIVEGMVRVALSARLHPREIASIAADSGASVVICDPRQALAIAGCLRREPAIPPALVAVGTVGQDSEPVVSPSLLAEEFPVAGVPFHGLTIDRLQHYAGSPQRPTIAASDTVMLMYSSGTTGTPKGIPVTHEAWMAQTTLAGVCLPPIGPHDVVLAVAPMSHFGGSIGLDCTIRGAATVTMADFKPQEIFESIDKHAVTVLPLIPIMLRDLSLSPAATPRPQLRAVPYGGSGISVDTLIMAEKLFPGALHQFYGLAEALAPISSLSGAEHSRAVERHGDLQSRDEAIRILSSAGRPLAEIEVRIGDPGEPAAGNREIFVRGKTVMQGYVGQAKESASNLANGWFATGDLGTVNADGYLMIAGRASQTIISGGFNVHPAEVERIIEQLPGVAAAVVIGLPHDRWGEAVTAIIERGTVNDAQDPIQAADVASICLSHLASYKKPKTVFFVDRLPRNSTGKIDRAAIDLTSLCEEPQPHSQLQKTMPQPDARN